MKGFHVEQQVANIVHDGKGGFRCSACGGGVRREATECKHCRVVFTTAPQGIHDKIEQLQKVEAGLIPGETVEAVFDLKNIGTGFLGITSKRVVFYDPSFLRKQKAVISIPYSRIVLIAAQDESGLFSGRGFFSSSKLTLVTSHGEHEFEFRGADKAHLAHTLILAHMVD